jgi:hypothetical protein
VAEVSHTGKCRIWKDGNKNAPPMHKESYRLMELEQPSDFEKVHSGSATYVWQGQVADFIRSSTGIAVNKALWRQR